MKRESSLAFFTALIVVVSAGASRHHALKFGETKEDYVLFQHDMSPFQREFTVCAWVRKLSTVGSAPSWFDYYAGGQPYEIQVSDNGAQTSMFGVQSSEAKSEYTVTMGTWFHNCLAWSESSLTRDLYIDGRLVYSWATPAGRTVNLGGYILLGAEQSKLGGGMDSADIFGGELYQLNMFSKKMSGSEIMRMAANMCMGEEESFGELRKLKWEDVILKTRHGDVTEAKNPVCGVEYYISLLNKTRLEQEKSEAELQKMAEKMDSTAEELSETQAELLRVQEALVQNALNTTPADCLTITEKLHVTSNILNSTNEKLENTTKELESTEEELEETKAELLQVQESTKTLKTTTLKLRSCTGKLNITAKQLTSASRKINETKEELLRVQEALESAENTPPDCPLNATVTSHWDLLYSGEFIGRKFTTERLEILRKTTEKLGNFMMAMFFYNIF